MKSVVIVGGGVIGLFSAVLLAKLGARVTVLEAEAEHADVSGPGASAAAAGMLAPISEAQGPHGDLAFASYAMWRDLQAGAEWADGVRFDGALIAAANTDEADALMARLSAQNRSGSRLGSSAFRKRSGFRTKLETAVFVEDEGLADPLRVLSGLAMQARAHGVIIEYGADVSEVTRHTATTLDDRTYEADIVVLAPGVWAGEKLIAAAPALAHVRPAKGQLVSVKLSQPLEPNFHAPEFYLVHRREDAVLGASMEFDRYDRTVDPEKTAALLAAAEAILPGEITPAGQAWAGVRPMSPDGYPIIGPSGDGLLVAAGHSRNGWLLAPITAEIVSAYVFEKDIPASWAALSPARFDETSPV